ncbi:Tex family protein [Longimicrobium sp.]|uniref:Tex family protein n=1 Tax=Longimicrobium sp. TaxID=2029185 RepID=UPI002E321935|nr:Tex family protein [Longimicrobium sp.]HEX6036762.1 Tex family protein [Longimicrobium sp.]
MQSSTYAEKIATELGLRPGQVAAALELLLAGNTIPFVARYRKEATGELDEVQLRDVRDRHEYLAELDERRAAILKSIDEQGKLTPALKASIERAETKSALEDLYLPYKPKRRTRATIALERGLGPLAELLWAGQTADAQLAAQAAGFMDAEKGVATADDALAGARDVIAERISEDAAARAYVRDTVRVKGVMESKAARGKENEVSKFQDYYDFSGPIKDMPSHRILAVRRGEAEGYLTARILAPDEELVAALRRKFLDGNRAPEQMGLAVEDAYRRLISPSVEVEVRMELKTRADEEAIAIFGKNLEALLLQPPAGGRTVLGVDPGYRTGCKLAVVSRTGALLATGVVYLHQEDRAKRELAKLVQEHGVELVAVGNGTASRESDKLAKEAVRDLPADVRPAVVMVNEAGASVYSASDLAREELPELDLTLRSAVSIARRLQDPLAELVKIDPKSIGVGQYQHDVSQTRLKRRLDETVESAVNRVGVELNTASPALLSYVAGIGPTVAQRIVQSRDASGPFGSRAELLKKVSGLGPKTFEQAAGFLRVRGGAHPLDGSAVHPERYGLVERIARDLSVDMSSLVGNESAVARIDVQKYLGDGVGLPTLEDIVAELKKPGRDPREQFEAPAFRDDVNSLEDLKEGMSLQGTVTNVVAFGAFVDIGVHQDGLVHVSELSDRFVKDPNDAVRVGDRVTVRVMSVDVPRKRIALSMKTQAGSKPAGGQGGGSRPAQGRDAGRKPAPQQKPAPKAPEPPKPGVAPNGMRIVTRK